MRSRQRTAAVVRVAADEPLQPIRPEPRHDEVLLVVSAGGQVVGQVFLEARPVISPEEQRRAIEAGIGKQLFGAWASRKLARAVRGDEPLATPDPPDVAVIVCTRGRPQALEACLASLAALTTRPAEIVVVDNSEGDPATADACRRHGARHVVEPLPGQARARNRGLLETTAELVAFTDDDCAVDAGWLDHIGEPFEDRMVQCVTGYIGPLELETPAQYLFERHGGFERHAHRVVFDITRQPPVLGAAVAGAGANMVFRREVFAEIGNFAEDLGPGTPARSSEDKYQFYRLLSAGYRIAYEPHRIVWHRHRSDMPALRRVLGDYGVAEFAYTSRCLGRHRDPAALHVQRWWIGHIARELGRGLLPGRSELPLALALAELRGALTGPVALRRSVAGRHDVPPLPPPSVTPREDHPGPRVVGEQPLMTVALATRNRRESLRHVLDALGRQRMDFGRFEVVVVVDGSTDGTAQMTRAFAAPYALRTVEQPATGLAAARNRGAREARHPVVVFLDDDMRPSPGMLDAHAAAHAAAPEPHYALGYFPPAIRGDSLWTARLRLWWEDHFRRKADPSHQWSFLDVIDGNSSIHAEQLFELGGFDERFSGGRRQDYEFGARLLRAGVPLAFHREAEASHHLDPQMEKAFANAREEGRYDVLLASSHPELKGRLTLAVLARRLRDGDGLPPPLGRAAARRSLAALGAFEVLGLRRRWQWRLRDDLLRAYAQGAADACGGPEGLREFVADIAGEGETHVETVHLDSPARVALPPTSQPLALRLCWEGHPVGTIDATTPNSQWDWYTVLRRVETGVTRPEELRPPVS